MQLGSLLALSVALLGMRGVAASAAAGGAGAEKPASVTIVELFTSEGCSSCPPADALLREINLKQTGAGQLIVGISEHVTYWNNLGWKDPYSAPGFTDRQTTYASRLSPEGPYTPQMVVNGRDQFVGSDGAALERALRDDAGRDHLALSIVSSSATASGVNVKFAVAGHLQKPVEIVAVLTDDKDRSNVLRGENGGRLLDHVSVARSMTHVATIEQDVEESVHVPLPDGFQLGGGAGHHLILFAQEPHQGAILGATTMPL